TSALVRLLGEYCVTRIGRYPSRGGASDPRFIASRVATGAIRKVELRPDSRASASFLRRYHQGRHESLGTRATSGRQAHVAGPPQRVLRDRTWIFSFGTYIPETDDTQGWYRRTVLAPV